MHQTLLSFVRTHDNKVRIKNVDATLFITQVELKPLFFLLKVIFWELNAKNCMLLHTHKLKTLLLVREPSKSLKTMHSLDKFHNGFL